METRNKSNIEFRNEVIEALAQHASQFDLLKTQHESHFDLLNNNMNPVTTSLQNHQNTITALLQCFSPTEYEDPSEALTRCRQVTTVAAYQEAFEGLSHRVDGLPEPFLVGCFIAGLRDDIRLDVKTKQAKTLGDTIGVARLVKERNLLQRKGKRFARSTVISHPLSTTNNGVLGPPLASKPINNTAPSLFRRITNQEARERHSTPADTDTNEDCTVDIATVESFPEISFHAITRTEHPQTICVIQKLKNKDVTVLIDGGSTHNFIDQSIVSQFGLQEIRDKTFQVMVANREKIVCGGWCLALSLLI
uniref:Retrotransposon gag domain-containing protein n=1 Tax=Populus alba TaxID=43335 RepID=A0A4U5PNW3_POPAL|nr:hypothetical protein D5086_0000203280 [Populus alba]